MSLHSYHNIIINFNSPLSLFIIYIYTVVIFINNITCVHIRPPGENLTSIQPHNRETTTPYQFGTVARVDLEACTVY